MSFLIRDARPDDAPAIAAIYAPFVLTSTATLELESPDECEIERRLRAVQFARGGGDAAAVDNGDEALQQREIGKHGHAKKA